jgi:hypothetical protein
MKIEDYRLGGPRLLNIAAGPEGLETNDDL